MMNEDTTTETTGCGLCKSKHAGWGVNPVVAEASTSGTLVKPFMARSAVRWMNAGYPDVCGACCARVTGAISTKRGGGTITGKVFVKGQAVDPLTHVSEPLRRAPEEVNSDGDGNKATEQPREWGYPTVEQFVAALIKGGRDFQYRGLNDNTGYCNMGEGCSSTRGAAMAACCMSAVITTGQTSFVPICDECGQQVAEDSNFTVVTLEKGYQIVMKRRAPWHLRRDNVAASAQSKAAQTTPFAVQLRLLYEARVDATRAREGRSHCSMGKTCCADTRQALPITHMSSLVRVYRSGSKFAIPICPDCRRHAVESGLVADEKFRTLYAGLVYAMGHEPGWLIAHRPEDFVPPKKRRERPQPAPVPKPRKSPKLKAVVPPSESSTRAGTTNRSTKWDFGTGPDGRKAKRKKGGSELMTAAEQEAARLANEERRRKHRLARQSRAAAKRNPPKEKGKGKRGKKK